jgi:hypothetical protein
MEQGRQNGQPWRERQRLDAAAQLRLTDRESSRCFEFRFETTGLADFTVRQETELRPGADSPDEASRTARTRTVSEKVGRTNSFAIAPLVSRRLGE